MKQPLLGQKILEWRKAKGLTQEELVERCNINVRTIQRIEAGEVTPRSYTVKAILEALEVKQEERLFDDLIAVEKGNEISDSNKQMIRFSAIAGVVYFLISIIEFYWDAALISSPEVVFPSFFIPMKIAVLATYSIFIFGFYSLAKLSGNQVLKYAALFFLVVNGLLISGDIIYGAKVFTDYQIYGFVKVIAFGIALAPLSIGLIFAKETFGSVYLVAGIIGLLASVIFITVVLSFIGLMVLTAFDLVCIYLLFTTNKQIHHKTQAGSIEKVFA